MRTRGRGWAVAAVSLVSVAGCAGSVELRSSFPDNSAQHVEDVVRRLPAPVPLAAPTNATGRPVVAVALHDPAPGVALFDATDGRELWRRPMRVDSPPVVGRSAVIVRSDQQVIALAIDTGAELWRHATGTIDLMGAAVDSGVVVLSFSTAGQRASMFREGRVVAVDERSGRTLWRLGPVERQFAAPAAFGGVAFVPWDRLSLSAFDLRTGEELARLLSRDDVISFVRADPEGVFYGSTGAYRLTAASASGTRGASTVHEPLVGNAPVAEGFGPDGFLGTTGGRNARNKVRFLWRGAPSAATDRVELTDDATYFLYYRTVFSFDASTGAVRWVRTLPQDAEAATVVPGGIVLLSSEGLLLALDARTGATVHSVDLGVPVAVAGFDLGPLPRRGAGSDAPSTSVREQLADVVFDPDARLAPARRFAVALLASMPEADVTRDLLDICSRRRVPQAIRDDAAMVLRTRLVGVEHLVAALERHYDYLEGHEAPPVGVIAAAVLHMRNEAAVDRLWRHMVDPETPRDDLAPIAAVLVELGNATLVPELRQFVVRYHADSAFHGAEDILLGLVRTVARHGTDADRAVLAALADDPSTLPALARDLAAAAEPPAVPGASDEGVPTAAERAVVPEQQVGQVLESARAQIRPCIQSALRRSPQLSELRLSLVVNERGELEELTVDPPDDILGSCLTLSLANASFPRGAAQRREATYTIRIEH